VHDGLRALRHVLLEEGGLVDQGHEDVLWDFGEEDQFLEQKF
jgi:hypothetical protein